LLYRFLVTFTDLLGNFLELTFSTISLPALNKDEFLQSLRPVSDLFRFI